MSVYRVRHTYETADGFKRVNAELVEAESERDALRAAEALVSSFKRQFRLRKVRLVGVELLAESPGPYVTVA